MSALTYEEVCAIGDTLPNQAPAQNQTQNEYT